MSASNDLADILELEMHDARLRSLRRGIQGRQGIITTDSTDRHGTKSSGEKTVVPVDLGFGFTAHKPTRSQQERVSLQFSVSVRAVRG